MWVFFLVLLTGHLGGGSFEFVDDRLVLLELKIARTDSLSVSCRDICEYPTFGTRLLEVLFELNTLI